ncbi:hypothetical protein DAI22_05g081201 [Oryza sativa Japonica Group]|nr:hypothetical protein DAI22_05g081201 [Oryza sativa Japonica Group]
MHMRLATTSIGNHQTRYFVATHLHCMLCSAPYVHIPFLIDHSLAQPAASSTCSILK